jgi:hypothetical protein
MKPLAVLFGFDEPTFRACRAALRVEAKLELVRHLFAACNSVRTRGAKLILLSTAVRSEDHVVIQEYATRAGAAVCVLPADTEAAELGQRARQELLLLSRRRPR